MAGGLMRRHAARGGPVVVVAVTDGEASHARSSCITPDELRRRRHAERADALDRLGVLAPSVHRLGLADQHVGEHLDDAVAGLRSLLRPGDLVVTVSVADRHPDHVATAAATRRAAHGLVDVALEAPTWALVHGTAPRPSRVLRLSAEEWVAKRAAVRAFRSQLEPLGPSSLDGPVVHPHELAQMLRPHEQFTAVVHR